MLGCVHKQYTKAKYHPANSTLKLFLFGLFYTISFPPAQPQNLSIVLFKFHIYIEENMLYLEILRIEAARAW